MQNDRVRRGSGGFEEVAGEGGAEDAGAGQGVAEDGPRDDELGVFRTIGRGGVGPAAVFQGKKYFKPVRWCAPLLFSGLLLWPASKKLTHS